MFGASRAYFMILLNRFHGSYYSLFSRPGNDDVYSPLYVRGPLGSIKTFRWCKSGFFSHETKKLNLGIHVQNPRPKQRARISAPWIIAAKLAARLCVSTSSLWAIRLSRKRLSTNSCFAATEVVDRRRFPFFWKVKNPGFTSFHFSGGTKKVGGGGFVHGHRWNVHGCSRAGSKCSRMFTGLGLKSLIFTFF